jgi:pimeloyl-ACP methyl ester carboxylesterase
MSAQETAAEAAAPSAPSWAYYTEPSFVDVGDLRVAYRRQGAGEPVVFLQGGRMTRRWLPFYEELSHAADVIVPELPGFGDTLSPPWLDGFVDLVLHCDELFDALGLDQFHLVGHALGGWTAAEFAVFYPDRLKSLTLLSPFGLRFPGHPLRDVFRLLPEEVPEVLFNGGGRFDELLSFGDQDQTFVLVVEESITAARLMWNPRYDYKLDHRLSRVRCPALIVRPDDDRIVPAEHFERWVELLPNARLETVHGAEQPTAHALMVQEPKTTAETIAAFIEEAMS